MDYLLEKCFSDLLDSPIEISHSDLKCYSKQALTLEDWSVKTDRIVLNGRFCYCATVTPKN